MNIEKLTAHDLNKVQEAAKSVLQTCFTYYSPEIRRQIITQDLGLESRLSSPVFHTLGAFVDDKVVGFVSGLIPIGGIVDIHWLMILKEFQGKGIGSKLINEYAKWAKAQGAHGIHLFSDEVNLLFYQKLGFTIVGLVKRSYYDHDEYFIHKTLL